MAATTRSIARSTGWRMASIARRTGAATSPSRSAVVATDRANTVTAVSDPFRVEVKPPHAIVLGLADGATLPSGKLVLLRGQGYYLEEERAELDDLVWTSSRDGDLGKGAFVEVPRLSDGTHRVTLAVGSGDRASRASITVQVGRERPGSKREQAG
jgi:hypothetical protein